MRSTDMSRYVTLHKLEYLHIVYKAIYPIQSSSKRSRGQTNEDSGE